MTAGHSLATAHISPMLSAISGRAVAIAVNSLISIPEAFSITVKITITGRKQPSPASAT